MVDVVLLAIGASLIWNGWRRGFVVSALSLFGMVIAAWAARFVVPFAAGIDSEMVHGTLALGLLVVALSIGSSVGSFVGRRVRSIYRWTPLRFIDGFAGAVLAGLAWVVIVWVSVPIAALLPVQSLQDAPKDSRILQLLKDYVPTSLNDLADELVKKAVSAATK